MDRQFIFAGLMTIVLIGVSCLLIQMHTITEVEFIMSIVVIVGIAGIYLLLVHRQRAGLEKNKAKQVDNTDWATRSPMYNRQINGTSQDEWKTTSKPTEWSAPASKEPKARKDTPSKTSPVKEAPRFQKNEQGRTSKARAQADPRRKHVQSPPREHPLVKRAAEFDKAQAQKSDADSNVKSKKKDNF